MLALGVQRVRRHHGPGQVQGFQQRREPGDLIGLAVHAGLPEHRAGLLIDRRQQVRGLPVAAGVPGAAQGFAVHGHRPPAAAGPSGCGSQPRAEPGPDCGVQRVRVQRFQDPADGCLVRLEPLGQRVIADPERSQDLRRRVRDPLADRRQRPRAGQHRRRRGQ